MKRLLIFWLPPAVWAAGIFYFSSIPALSVSEEFWLDFATRKPAHLAEFIIFSILIFRALNNTIMKISPSWQIILASFIISQLYGIFDEIHQSFVPAREGKIFDVILDGVGAGIGSLVAWSRLQQNQPKKPTSLAKNSPKG